MLTPRLNKYIPAEPMNGPQHAFLLYDGEEALYGGAAGGGKSYAMLMAALQYVDVPGYRALILRRTLKMLKKPDGILSLARTWLEPTDARFNENDLQWRFPSGAVLEFGYLDHPKHLDNYQGAAYDFVGFDELTQWANETWYVYLFSRMRRDKESGVPSRMRATANPGGPGHSWVKARFIDNPEPPDRVFFPASRHDNTELDQESYGRNLARLDPVTRARLDDGDWEVVPQGPLWGPGHYPEYPGTPRELARANRDAFLFSTWDCKGKLYMRGPVRAGESFVSGQMFADIGGDLYLLDEEHGAWGLDDTEEAFHRLASRWPQATLHKIENKALGPELLVRVRRGDPEKGYRRIPAQPHEPDGNKEVRCERIQPYVLAGQVKVPSKYVWPPVEHVLAEWGRAPAAPNDRTDTLIMAVETRLHDPDAWSYEQAKAAHKPEQVQKALGRLGRGRR